MCAPATLESDCKSPRLHPAVVYDDHLILLPGMVIDERPSVQTAARLLCFFRTALLPHHPTPKRTPSIIITVPVETKHRTQQEPSIYVCI